VTLLRVFVRGADIARYPPRFFFQRPDGEFFRLVTIKEIILNKGFETAAPLALGNVYQLMQNQLSITPGVGPDNDAVSNRYPTAGISDDLGVSSCLSQLFVIW
jgi:hypothetical protein